MRRRSRTYEVEMDGTSVLVQVEDLGEGPNGMGRAYRLSIGEQDPVEVIGEQLHAGNWNLLSQGRSFEAGVCYEDEAFQVDILGIRHDLTVTDPMRKALRLAGSEGSAVVRSQMPGRVVRVLVEPGQNVQKGEALMVIEAMKMENEIKAPREGSVKRVCVNVGDLLEAKALLIELG